jgi:hypothetical protein
MTASGRDDRGIGTGVVGVLLTTWLLSTPTAAQQLPRPVEGHAILVTGPQIADPGGQLTADAMALESIDVGPPVKDAPYSAEATTEIVQSFTDGNRIVRRTSALLYRDSRGRTRREATLEGIAGIIVTGDPLRTITVSDPESGTTYFIDTDKHVRVVRQRAHDPRVSSATAPPRMPVERRGAPRGGASQGGGQEGVPGTKTNEESLGTRVIEGIATEGTRTTVTIPSGAIGNERPIKSVTERWFSPELRIVILSRRSDPRFGETTYRLTKITRAEPPAALFEVRH